jgi:hypothetical protein
MTNVVRTGANHGIAAVIAQLIASAHQRHLSAIQGVAQLHAFMMFNVIHLDQNARMEFANDKK